MKTKILLSGLLAALVAVVRAGTNDLTAALQKGLFEEEANHNLAAAIQAYQAVIAQFDKDRKLAATAVFRLGECYRKQGSTNEAVAQYERILREFADQPPLVELSRRGLAAQGALAAGAPPLYYQWRKDGTNLQMWVAGAAGPGAANQEQKRLLGEEIKLVEKKLAAQQRAREMGALDQETLSTTERELLELKRQMAALDAGQPAADQEQKRLLQEEIKLVESKLASRQKAHEVGRLDQEAVWATQRELLELKRQMAALDAGQPAAPAAAQPAATSAEAEEIARIQEMIKNSPDLINAKEGGQMTPLHQAAAQGRLIVAQYLLDNGADVNSKNAGGTTPLWQAANAGHRAMVELLLKHGAAVDAADHSGETPLHRAATTGFKSVAEALLANRANVNARDEFGDTPLHKAAAAGQTALVELLLAHKADVNAKNPGPPPGYNPPNQKTKGATPLVEAILARQAPVVKLLLANKAEVNFECEAYSFQGINKCRGSPLHFAVAVNSPEIVELLLKSGANPNAQASYDRESGPGLTPLWAAVVGGQKENAELLLAHQAEPNIADKEGRTPLHRATIQGSKELVKLLLAHNAEVNRQDQSGRTPLSYAAAGSHTEIAALLLDHKADPNLKGQAGETPLHYAVRLAVDSGRKEMVELLRAHGAIEELPKMDQVEIRRPSVHYSEVVFIKGTNNYNRFTLLELIAVHYGFVAVRPEGPRVFEKSSWTRQGSLAFPDLGMVTIRRPTPDTIRRPTPDGLGRTAIVVHVNDILLHSPDCSGDTQLQWGDAVEIPEADHPINATWQGLPEETLVRLKRCLDRQVQLTVKGQTTNLLLKLQTTAPASATFHSPGSVWGNAPAFTLLPVLQSSGLLRASSDLSRVVVKRRDATTGQLYELVFACSGPGLAPDFWLREGDAIEVPDKP